MLIIPMGTDAPIYHWPRATVALIVLNIAVMIAVPPPAGPTVEVDEEGHRMVVEPEPGQFEKYALTLSDGIHPIQWVTHNFLHYGWIHLIGNMVFLWAFGIVVEGKLGLVRYLLVYLLIGTLHGAFTQLILLRAGIHGHAAGASAVIFGLLAICMVWAPHNEVNCTWVMLFGLRVFARQFDLRYTWLAALYIGEEIFNLMLWGFVGRLMISEAGHLSGALWGTVIGFGMLKMGWVDCEGWDVLSLWKKNRKLAGDWKLRTERLDRRKKSERAPRRHVIAKGAEEGPTEEERSATALKKVRKLLDMGDWNSAVVAFDRASRTIPNWPDGPDLLSMIKHMHSQGAEADSLPLMREYCQRYPGVSSRMRLKLAQVLIRDRQKPTGALRVLAEIPEGSLTGQLDAARLALIRQAERMVNEGVLELEGED